MDGGMNFFAKPPALLPKLTVRFKAEVEPLDFELLMDIPLAK